MTTIVITEDDKSSEDTLRRLSKLKDEDIVFDNECPELTPKMEKALACSAALRNCEITKQIK